MVDHLISVTPATVTNYQTYYWNKNRAYLPEAISCIVTEERNGEFELEMEYPITGINYDQLQLRNIIVAKPNPYSGEQGFRIYSITRPINGVVTVNAEHISYDLTGYPVSPFSAESLEATLAAIPENTPIETPFTFTTDKTSSAVLELTTPCSIRSLLGGMDGSILDIYGGEYEFDNYDVKLLESRGADRGVVVRYGKNLTDLEQEENCSNVYTGVYPYWYAEPDEDEDSDSDSDSDDSETSQKGLLELPEKYISASGTYDYERIYPLDLSSEWTEMPTEDELRERAEEYMSENSIGVPKVSLTVSFVQLSQSSEYSEYAALEKIQLCDTVGVEFPALGVSTSAKCIKTVYNAVTGKYESIELGDATSSLESTLSSQSQSISSNASAAASNAADIQAAAASITELTVQYAEIQSLYATVAYVESLQATYATIESLTVVQADISDLSADIADINDLFASYATIESLTANYATIESLTAVQADITTLNADIADINDLFASYATITYLQTNYALIDDLTAATARITDLEANTATVAYLKAYYATIDQLNSAYADITTLTSDVASIRTLLAGNESVETLQAIHLTSDNVVIDDAIITNAMIVSLTADKLTTGTIYTDSIKIANNTGENLLIDGSTIQISDGTYVRVQIGEDGTGDYNLYLWNAEGTLIWNAQGLTAEGLTGNGAIIKDMAVADDANIQGSKLDIDSVISYIEENGSLTVDYANVTIDNTTLSAWYATVNTSVSNLESTTSTLQTELTEVNGQITAKVWQTDITEAISGISIGGRNYLTDTRDFDSGTWVNSHSAYFSLEEDDEGYTAATFAEYSTLTWRYVQSSANSILFSTLRGQDVVLSFELRSDDYEAINDSTSEGAHIIFALCTGDSTSRTLYKNVTMYTEELSDEWQKFTIAATLSDSYFSSGSGTIDDDTRFYVQFYDRSTYSMQIRKFKLELGTVATDWTPAPEDAESSITSLHDQYTTVTQTISGIETEIGDISTTVEDNYTSLSSKVTTISETVDGITTTVSELETTVGDNYDTLSSQITTVETTVNGITTTVSELETTVTDNYKTLSNQITTVETTVNGITTTVSELETTVDSYYTTLSGKITTVETTASGLSATIAEVQNVVAENLIVDGTFDGYTTFGSSYSWYRTSSSYMTVTTYNDKSCILFSYGGVNASYYIRQTVNLPVGTYVVRAKLACGKDSTGENYTPIARARIGTSYAYLNDENGGDLTTDWVTYSATITITSASTYFYLYCYNPDTAGATEMYATDIAVYEAIELEEASSQITTISATVNGLSATVSSNYDDLSSQITALAGSISLSVTGALGSTASIVLTANGSSTTETLDLSGVRSAFASDTTAITISAGTITFASNTLIIDSDQLTLDSSGNATYSGKLSAASGSFAGDVTAYAGVVLGGYLTVYANLITNSDFVGFSDSWASSGWYRYPTSGDYMPYSATYNGLECVWMCGSGTSYYIRWKLSNTLAAGTYIVKAKLAAVSGSEDYAYVRAKIGTTATGTGNTGNLCKAGDMTTDWQTFSTVITITATSYQYLHIFAIGGVNYPFYITDVELIDITETRGYIGSQTGDADGTTTTGIAIMNSTKENYLIATDSGIRMTGGSDSIYIVTDSGIALNSESTINASVAITVSSDRALKNHVEALPNAYETLFDRMEPVRYYLNHEQDNRYHLGYIANDVLEAAADAGLTWDDIALVNQNPETGLLGLNYTEIISLQHHKIKKLERRIEALERSSLWQSQAN